MVFDLGSMLAQWEGYGLFDYLLPFLLIFALVYGILSHAKVFGENNAVHLTIALVLAILALRLGFVQDFYREAFPRLAVALAVLLIFAVLAAAFWKEHEKGWHRGLYILGGIAALIVVFNSFNALGYWGSSWWYDWGSLMIGALLIIGLIIAISVSGKKSSSSGGGGGGGRNP